MPNKSVNDRYFSDRRLSKALIECKKTSLGVDRKRRFFPNKMKLVRNRLYSSWFYFSDANLLMSYQSQERKKLVISLSTLYERPEVFDDEKRLPFVIHDYKNTLFVG